jgi:hypothetical protein
MSSSWQAGDCETLKRAVLQANRWWRRNEPIAVVWPTSAFLWFASWHEPGGAASSNGLAIAVRPVGMHAARTGWQSRLVLLLSDVSRLESEQWPVHEHVSRWHITSSIQVISVLLVPSPPHVYLRKVLIFWSPHHVTFPFFSAQPGNKLCLGIASLLSGRLFMVTLRRGWRPSQRNVSQNWFRELF